jgi:hypothetical protein
MLRTCQMERGTVSADSSPIQSTGHEGAAVRRTIIISCYSSRHKALTIELISVVQWGETPTTGSSSPPPAPAVSSQQLVPSSPSG